MCLDNSGRRGEFLIVLVVSLLDHMLRFLVNPPKLLVICVDDVQNIYRKHMGLSPLGKEETEFSPVS